MLIVTLILAAEGKSTPMEHARFGDVEDCSGFPVHGSMADSLNLRSQMLRSIADSKDCPVVRTEWVNEFLYLYIKGFCSDY